MTHTELQNCGKCGLCLNACPVYKILKQEQSSPRAKLQLIKAHDNKKLASSSLLKEIVSKCLMCGSCTASCPSGINHYSRFMEMRKKMVEDCGETPAIKSLIYLLSREYRAKIGAGVAKTGQKILPEKFARSYQLGNIPLKNFPLLNSTPLRKAYDEVIFPDKKQIETIVYFTGCATNYLYDDTGSAFIGMLKHMGYKIIIPKEQTCCSIPLLFHGAEDAALKNILANINALKNQDADTILVDCSTCGEALKNEYPKIVENQGKDVSDAKKISVKVTDALSFIDQNFDLLEFEKSFTKKTDITYHAPCHTRNSFQSHITAEKLLGKLPFANYRKTPDVEECCGGGGTFFYEYPEVTKKMVSVKKTNAVKTKARYWATDCPVCRINLAGSLDEKDNMQVVHPVTLIYRALKTL